MSFNNGNVYQPSPASSSDVVDPFGGTPYTSLTAFSPEGGRIVKSAAVNIGGDQVGSNQDPFVSSNAQTRGKLSAKASAFQPSLEMRAVAVPASSIDIEQSQKMYTSMSSNLDGDLTGSKSPSSAYREDSSTHFGTFTTDSTASRVLKVTGKTPVATFLSFVEASKRKFRGRGIAKRGIERPEQLGNSYYLRLSNIHDATELYTGIKTDNPGLIVEYVSPVTFGQLFSPGQYSIHEGQVLLTVNYPPGLTFDHGLLDRSLVHMLEVEGKLCAWHRVPGTEDGTFFMLAEFEDAACASGVVTGIREINRNPKLQNITVSVELFRPDLAEQVFSQQNYHPDTPTRYQGEHIDLNSAFGNISLDNYTFSPDTMDTHAGNIPSASRMPYMAPPSSFPIPNALPFVVGGPGNNVYMPPVTNSFQQAYPSGLDVQATPILGESVFHSLGGQSYTQGGSFIRRELDTRAGFQKSQLGNEVGYYNQGLHGQSHEPGQYGRPSGRRPYAPRTQHTRNRQHVGPANSHHNHVDIAKIKQGIDVRTTVMLRNIPNKVDQEMLKDIVDESSFGRYDFMYLRIDFSNNCNVGYAFINFTDPLDIVDFVVARSNQKWHKFKSDKVAEVSYATIQGKDCLVQKFRNSSVMLEPPHYRPKLFKTVHDEYGRAGEEEPFPESDNASKLKRSCENAEHVGLFAPSAGQHLRDEQRRRRSQYDRGTSLAEREEYGLDSGLYAPFLQFPSY